MKKEIFLITALILSGFILFLSLIGFKNPISIPGNIEENFFILSIGIDKGSIEGSYKLTILSEKFSGGGSSNSSSSQGKKADIVTVEGETVFQAVRNFSMVNSKSLFWGHIKYIILSEEVAKEDVLQPLDFFIRDHETRLNTTIVISKNSSSEALLRMGDKMDKFIPDLLDGLFNNIGRLSISEEIYLLDLMKNFNNSYEDACIPAISIMKVKENVIKDESQSQGKSSGESDSQNSSGVDNKSENGDAYCLDLNGFATFDGVKLIGYVEDGMARGLNFIKGKVKSGVIVLKNSADKEMSTELIDSESNIKIKLNKGMPEADINIGFSTNIDEVLTRKDIFNEEDRNKMTEEQTDIVKKEAEEAVKYAQKNDTDIIKISNAIAHQYPSEWEEIKKNWNDIFKKMKINVNVESKINRTYHIRQPIASYGGDNQ